MAPRGPGSAGVFQSLCNAVWPPTALERLRPRSTSTTLELQTFPLALAPSTFPGQFSRPLNNLSPLASRGLAPPQAPFPAPPPPPREPAGEHATGQAFCAYCRGSYSWAKGCPSAWSGSGPFPSLPLAPLSRTPLSALKPESDIHLPVEVPTAGWAAQSRRGARTQWPDAAVISPPHPLYRNTWVPARPPRCPIRKTQALHDLQLAAMQNALGQTQRPFLKHTSRPDTRNARLPDY
jgi:hypothetical protein